MRRQVASDQSPKQVDAAGRAGLEPLSILLPAVAALGAVASIAAVAWLAEDSTSERPKVKRRVDVIVRDLETSCLGLAEILRRLIRQSPMFGLIGASSTSPIKFGLVGTRVDAQQAQFYTQLANDVATMLVLATQASFDLISVIEDGTLTPPEDVLYKFADAQARLNNLLTNRPTLPVAASTTLEVAEQLTALVRTLKT